MVWCGGARGQGFATAPRICGPHGAGRGGVGAGPWCGGVVVCYVDTPPASWGAQRARMKINIHLHRLIADAPRPE